MAIARPITPSGVDAIATGVFAEPNPLVVEAFSVPDQKPLIFKSQGKLADYMKSEVSRARGLAYVFVVYPDMGGKPVRTTIHLDPKHCPGQKLRYTWEGWGLISIQLYGSAEIQMSEITANSAARAKAWASTYPELGSPNEWNWKAVGSHVRRLQRILKKVT